MAFGPSQLEELQADRLFSNYVLAALNEKRSDRFAIEAEVVRRMTVTTSKISAESAKTFAKRLLDDYMDAKKDNKMTEMVALSAEILRRMKPAAPPSPEPAPAPTIVAPPTPRPPRSPGPPLPPPGPPFDNNRLHEFFLAAAEWHEEQSRESAQFAALCRNMCEKIKPELYDKAFE
jgi:hypothetical protein